MSRLRALLAVLLAVTWCSAAWHVNLEAIGLILDHRHHAHGHGHTHEDHHAGHLPADAAHDDHEEVFARHVAKDQLRVGAAVAVCFTLPGLETQPAAAVPPGVGVLKSWRQRRETDPPLAHVWQFIRRCAPDSAAPPALG